jgi:hypothetical protein
MAEGYTKLFASIIDSTIWRESKETKIVWITMLAKANKHGIVESSLPGLADAARVTLDECISALKVLMAPDDYSRTKEHEGRRIRETDGGWEILNHTKYRARLSRQERLEYQAAWQRNYRAQQKAPIKMQNGQSEIDELITQGIHPDVAAEIASRPKSAPGSVPGFPGVDARVGAPGSSAKVSKSHPELLDAGDNHDMGENEVLPPIHAVPLPVPGLPHFKAPNLAKGESLAGQIKKAAKATMREEAGKSDEPDGDIQ